MSGAAKQLHAVRKATEGDPPPPPPQNLEAEESVLGAMMLTAAAIDAVAANVDASDFYRLSHGRIFRAALDLHTAGKPVDPITLIDELERRGELEDIGGRVRIHELAALVPATANAAHHALIVRERAHDRETAAAANALAAAALAGVEIDSDLRARVLHVLEPRLAARETDRLVDGASFILDAEGIAATAVWGHGDEIAWACGEGLMLVGPQGVGKTTLLQQLALARIGLREKILGLPVPPCDGLVLYIAADRPRQAERSLARMVSEDNREALRDKLRVWRGPLPFLLNDPEAPARLVQLVQHAGARDVYIDSLKDLALDLSEPATGARVNLALQALLAAGIEVAVAHHQRKASGDNKKPDKLADVFGSTWLTAGMGSVILLWGEPGDAIVELRHLKQPIEEIGPLTITHDHTRGHSTRHAAADLEQLLLDRRADGLTPTQAATALFGSATPKANEVEKARRRLRKLVNRGDAVHIPSMIPNEPGKYVYNGPGAASEKTSGGEQP